MRIDINSNQLKPIHISEAKVGMVLYQHRKTPSLVENGDEPIYNTHADYIFEILSEPIKASFGYQAKVKCHEGRNPIGEEFVAFFFGFSDDNLYQLSDELALLYGL